MVTALLFLPVIFTALLLSNRGLRELTAQREQILRELRPIFLEYAEDNKHFPENLDQMVPDYLAEIPAVLLKDSTDDSYKRIEYFGREETGIFLITPCVGRIQALSMILQKTSSLMTNK